MSCEIKCKKCRKVLIWEDAEKVVFLDAHSTPFNKNSDNCATINEANNIFFNEDSLPSWIILRLEAEEWSKGRLNCPNCDSRIGGFNFISGQKCGCANYLLPPVHMIKSKVDLIKPVN